jgi:hypothetical protein
MPMEKIFISDNGGAKRHDKHAARLGTREK